MLRLAEQAALTVDPHLAERRREHAQKNYARVSFFREQAGTAGLSGRDLPPDEALAAMATVNARAEEYKESGAFGDTPMDVLRARAYLDLINGVPGRGADRARRTARRRPTTAQAWAAAQRGIGAPKPGPAQTTPVPARTPEPTPDDCPCAECDGSCVTHDDDDPDGSGQAGDDDDPTTTNPMTAPAPMTAATATPRSASRSGARRLRRLRPWRLRRLRRSRPPARRAARRDRRASGARPI